MDPTRFAAPARRRSLLAALAALLPGARAVLGPGEAAGRRRRKRKPPFATRAVVEQTEFTVPVGGAPTAETAVCPAGTRAVGGGVVQSGPDVLYVRSSAPVLGDAPVADGAAADRWYAVVSTITNLATQPVAARVFALCSASADAVAVEERYTAPPGGYRDGFAPCPTGTRAVGGGVLPSNPGNALVIASGPLAAGGVTLGTDDGDAAAQWYGAIRNYSDSPQDFRVVALCSAKSRATVEATQVTVQSLGQVGADYAVCPGTKRAIGGGVVQSGEAAGFGLRASGPLDAGGQTLQTGDGDKATQWYATVENFSAEPRTFRIFAICE